MLGHCDTLEEVLPKIAGLLGETAVRYPVSDLAIFGSDALNRSYMDDPRLRDEIVSVHGLKKSLPPITRSQVSERDKPGADHGITIYRCRDFQIGEHGDEELMYTECNIPNPYWQPYSYTVQYIVVLKRNVTALHEYLRKQELAMVESQKAPILAAGILEDIIQNSLGFILHRDEIASYGVRICRGVLVDGLPGNGKTMVCQWLKKLCIQHQIEFGTVTAAEIDHSYHNGGFRIYGLFNTHTVTFLDDVGVSSLTRLQQGGDEKACDILSAMDGVKESRDRILVFTTNEELDKVDGAFLRPGRIDCRFRLKKPSKELRRKLIAVHWPEEIRKYLRSPGCMKAFLRRSKDYSFADLEAIRSLLVSDKVMGSGEWAIEQAFAKFEEQRSEKGMSRKSAGFEQTVPRNLSKPIVGLHGGR